VFRGPTFEGRGQKEKGGEGKQGVHFCPRKKKRKVGAYAQEARNMVAHSGQPPPNSEHNMKVVVLSQHNMFNVVL